MKKSPAGEPAKAAQRGLVDGHGTQSLCSSGYVSCWSLIAWILSPSSDIRMVMIHPPMAGVSPSRRPQALRP